MSIIYNGNKLSYGIKNFVLNTETELQKINIRQLATGSTVFINENSKYYKLNSKKQWIEIFPYGKASSSNDSSGNVDGGEFDDSGYAIYDGGSIDGSDPL